MEKEIIGYKLIKPEYVQAACKIEGYISMGESIIDGKDILFNDPYTKSRKEGFEKLKKAGVLDLWFEAVYKEEVKFQENEWLYWTSSHNRDKVILRFKGYQNSRFSNRTMISTKEYYYISNDKLQTEGESDNYCYTDDVTKATPEQIKEILTIVAKHKGFVEGVKFRSAYSDYIFKIGKNLNYYDYEDALSTGGNYIYYKCKWAIIVKDELPIINGNKGKIVDGFVYYGCLSQYKYSISSLVGLLLAMNNCNIEQVNHSSGKIITKEQIEQMLKCLENESK